MAKIDKDLNNRRRQPSTAETLAFAARCSPPAQHNLLVERSRLIKRLDDALAKKLITIIAPAGFGKTVLLTQWWSHLQNRSDLIRIWLTVDPSIHDAAVLVRDLAKAAATSVPSVNDYDESAWPELVAQLALDGRQALVILDGVDERTAPMFEEIIASVARQPGLPLTLAIASRHRRLAAAELHANGLSVDIEATDLAMSAAEVAALFDSRFSIEEAAILRAKTEGWPVAVQACLRSSMQQKGVEPRILIERLALNLASYLDEQVLQSLPETVRLFLEDTSILRQLDASLANAARHADDGHAMLSALENLRGLMVPADSAARSLRYNQLLRQHLQSRLLHRGWTHAIGLHRNAAVHLAARGRLVEAVFHARETGDKELAIELVRKAGGWKLIVEYGHGFAQGLLELFDAQEIMQSFDLLITQAYLRMRSGDVAASRHSLDLCKVLSGQSERADHDLAIMEIMFRNYAHAPIDAGWRDRIAGVVEKLALNDNVGRGVVLICSANVELDLGDFARAEAEANGAKSAMRLAGSGVGERYCEVMLAQSLMHRGRLIEADSLLQDVIANGKIEFGRGSNSAALGSGLRAAIVALQGDYETAGELLSEAQEMLEGVEGWADVLVSIFRTQFELEVRIRGRIGGTETIDRIRKTAARRSLLVLSELADAWELELMTIFGDALAAREIVTSRGMRRAFESAPLPFAWRTKEALGFALARWHLIESRSAAALTLLHSLRVSALKNERMLDVARIDLAAASAYRQRGESRAMLQHIESALIYVQRENVPMLAFELGTQSEVLLQSFVSGRKPPDKLRQFAQTILKQERHAEGLRIAGLSDREIDILQQLCLGHSNKEIGWRLSLSENTVKFHLKRIYAKLGVATRSGAVAVATDHGFFSTKTDK
jgi:LuxR family transcriptional regulator, maltose regulon positive regulatory protein